MKFFQMVKIIIIINLVHRITDIDVSYDEQRIYFCGLANINGVKNTPIVMVVKFDPTLAHISSKTLTDIDYGIPRRLKRVKGSEVIIVGCDRHFAVLNFSNNAIQQISTLRDIHDGAITDFVVRGQYMYSKAYGEPDLMVTRFGKVGFESSNSRPINTSTTPTYSKISNSSYQNQSRRSNLGSSKYQEVSIQKIQGNFTHDLEKVVLSKNGSKLYTGGKGLHIFEWRDGGYVPEVIDNKRSSFLFNFLDNDFFAIKATNSGHLVIQEPTSNDLRVLTSTGNEVTRHKGLQKCVFGKLKDLN